MRGRTKSGLPGKLRSLRSGLNLALRSHDFTARSGFVPLERTARMIRERSSVGLVVFAFFGSNFNGTLASHRLETLVCKPSEPLCLGDKSAPQANLHVAFGNGL